MLRSTFVPILIKQDSISRNPTWFEFILIFENPARQDQKCRRKNTNISQNFRRENKDNRYFISGKWTRYEERCALQVEKREPQIIEGASFGFWKA